MRYSRALLFPRTGGPETVAPAAESPRSGSCPAGGEHHQWTFGASQLPGDAADRGQKRLPQWRVEWRGTTRLEPSDGRLGPQRKFEASFGFKVP